jgi:hypothetical protein
VAKTRHHTIYPRVRDELTKVLVQMGCRADPRGADGNRTPRILCEVEATIGERGERSAHLGKRLLERDHDMVACVHSPFVRFNLRVPGAHYTGLIRDATPPTSLPRSNSRLIGAPVPRVSSERLRWAAND